jgi:hypothetical protein
MVKKSKKAKAFARKHPRYQTTTKDHKKGQFKPKKK